MKRIKVLLFPDMLPWERAFMEPMLAHFPPEVEIQLLPATQNLKRVLSEKDPETVYWLWAADWRGALRAVSIPASQQVFVSVLRLKPQQTALPALVLKALFSDVPRNVSLFVYSPLNYRFFLEMGNMTHDRVSLLPLPFPRNFKKDDAEKSLDRPPVVGTFGPFVGESNLNYFLTVAHYVNQRRPDVRFRVMGWGPLTSHLEAVAREIGIDRAVQVLQTTGSEALLGLDVFLNVPLRNEHFGALLAAAAAKISVVSSEISGVEDLLVDGKSGFVTPVHDTKSMAELVIRLLENRPLRRSLADHLFTILDGKYAYEKVAKLHHTVMVGGTADLSRQAA